MLENILGEIASQCWPYLVAKSSHVGVDVDGLACPLHHCAACSHQTRGHGFLLGAILSHHVVVGGGALQGDAKASGLDIS
jgi:hypothetical protein